MRVADAQRFPDSLQAEFIRLAYRGAAANSALRPSSSPFRTDCDYGPTWRSLQRLERRASGPFSDVQETRVSQHAPLLQILNQRRHRPVYFARPLRRGYFPS